jgi:hypothetical protein
MKKMASLLLAGALTLGLTGCGEILPVKNVNNAPVLVSAKSYTEDQVRDAILLAGRKLKWEMSEKSPGVIAGNIYSRGTESGADILITYTKSEYSINYVDSKGLKYDGKNIDNRYNRWINNLTKEIDLTLMQSIR